MERDLKSTPGPAGQAHPSTLFTAGYEGRVQDELFEVLIAAGAKVLLDVRAVPLSRKAGFSKRMLAASAQARGLRYLNIRSLGTPKAGRQAARAGRTAEMTAIFDAHMRTEEAQAGLAEARAVVTAAPSCLLCFERDHTNCHRRIVADLLMQQTGQSVVNL